MSLLQAYKYKLYPTKTQEILLQETLNRCRELYNAALQERRDCYNMVVKRHPSYYDEEVRRQITKQHAITYGTQAAQLPEIKELRPEYNCVHSQVLQDVLRRLQKAMDGFFRRVAAGQTPGYPRFQTYGRYDSFIYPQLGFSLTEDHRVCLSKIGTIKLKMPKVKGDNGQKVLYLPVGQLKTCTIKREGDLWFVVFTAEVEPELVYHPSE
jgi:putative transposase